MSKRLLLAASIAGLIAGPAFAQTSNIPYTPGAGGPGNQLGANTCGSYACPQYSQSFQSIQFNGGTGMTVAGAPSASPVNVYAANTALCTSATVGTCNTALSGLYFILPTGTIHVTGGTLRITDVLSTAWPANSQIQIDLFSAAATLNAGDGSAYKLATGTGLYLGSLLCTTSLGEQNDGVVFKCNPIGGPLDINLGSANAHLFATFWTNTGTGVVTANSTLTANLTGTF